MSFPNLLRPMMRGRLAGISVVNFRGSKAFYALRFCLLLIQLKKRLLIVIPRLTRNPASSSTVTFGN